MTLSEQIQKDIVAAMRAKEELRLSVLRMVKAAIQLKEVEKKRPLDGSSLKYMPAWLMRSRSNERSSLRLESAEVSRSSSRGR